jgi:hypothetical protein
VNLIAEKAHEKHLYTEHTKFWLLGATGSLLPVLFARTACPQSPWGADKPPDGGGRPPVAHKQTVEPVNQNLGVTSI